LIRLVVDTNVFVSAVIKANSPPSFVVRWLETHGCLLKTAATERELFDVLARPLIDALISSIFRQGITTLFSRAESIHVREPVAACRDPKDDKFLELAVNGRADVIVSGDADLLTMRAFREIPIITSTAFLQVIIRR
jgi:uncharacterized protein